MAKDKVSQARQKLNPLPRSDPRALTASLVIAHLAELSRRKGDLKLGYPNLFDESTLEVLCRRHNLLRAEQAYGAKHIQQKIEERRMASASSAQCASP